MQNTRRCYARKKRASLRLVDVVTLAGLVKVVEEHQNDKARDLPTSIRRFPRNSTSCNPARVISTRSRKMFACFSPRLFGRKYSSPFPLSIYAYSMFQKVGTNLQERLRQTGISKGGIFQTVKRSKISSYFKCGRNYFAKNWNTWHVLSKNDSSERYC